MKRQRFFLKKIEEPDRIRALILLGAFLLSAFFCLTESFRRFEYVTYDYRCRIRGPREARPEIVVIEISDDSVARIGRWPWDRDWHAALVSALSEAGAKAIVFDVIFSEPSEPTKDKIFEAAIRLSGRVHLAEVIESSVETGSKKVLRSLPPFCNGARPGGHINLYPDVDGVMRRIPFHEMVGERYVPQLSLAVAEDLLGIDPTRVHVTGSHLHLPAKDQELEVPLDAHGNYIINWVGRWREAYHHYSFADVVTSYAQFKRGERPKLDLTRFKDKICYVGTTASGLFDIRPTPLEPSYPAVGVNLTILNNLLERKFIHQLPKVWEYVLLWGISFLVFLSTKSTSYFRNAILTLSVAVIHALLAILIFSYWGWWISMTYPIFLVFSAYFAVTLYNQLAITIERSKLVKLATRDSLTGLYNVGHFKLLLKAELATLAIRRDRVMSLVMSDVDNFKHTNDTYGHLTGDAVLREVGAVVRSTCRALDVAARYGGEEFIVMLPGATAEEAFKVADKIRQAVAQKVFPHEKGEFKKTISLGVTQVNPDEKDIDAIVGRADKALYEAKKTGKNKVVIAELPVQK